MRDPRLDRRSQPQHHGFRGLELVGVTLQTDERARTPSAQLSFVMRLGDEIVAAGLDAGQTVAPPGPCRDDDDRNETRGRAALHRSADVEARAMAARGEKVHQDEIRRFSGACREHGLGRLNDANLTALGGKKAAQKPRADLIIVGDENIRTEHVSHLAKQGPARSAVHRLVRFLLGS